MLVIVVLLHIPVSHLCKVGALGGPHRSCTKTEHKGGGEEGVELGVELGGDVGGVAEDAHHQSPLHRQLVNHDGGEEHAGEDQGGVHHRVRPDAKSSHHVDGGLQLRHGFKGNEKKQEREGDDEDISVDPAFLYPRILRADVWCGRSCLCKDN